MTPVNLLELPEVELHNSFHVARFRNTREHHESSPRRCPFNAANPKPLLQSAVTMAGPAPPSARKPRRKIAKKVDHLSKSDILVRSPTYPLEAFLWPARGSVSQWEIQPLILMVVGLFRWAAGFWGYSGMSVVAREQSVDSH